MDSEGDLFIADTFNDRIREVVKATGDIITVAGNGSWGSSAGDGGPATAASVYEPQGVAVDAAGDLFIADTQNDRIREVIKATGDIITVAGGGANGLGDGGTASVAGLGGPTGVAVDAAGNLFIADFYEGRIREVVKATGDIITVAGGGTDGLGDGGPATSASLNDIEGVTVDAVGNLFIADWGTTVFARSSRPPATSSPCRAMVVPATAVTGAKLVRPSSTLRSVLRWTRLVISSSPMRTTIGSARSQRAWRRLTSSAKPRR